MQVEWCYGRTQEELDTLKDIVRGKYETMGFEVEFIDVVVTTCHFTNAGEPTLKDEGPFDVVNVPVYEEGGEDKEMEYFATCLIK